MLFNVFYTNLKKNINKKKNLVFLLPNFAQGGAGNSIYKLCKNINYNKYNIFIISLGKNFYKKNFLKMNICVIELSNLRLLLAIKKIKLIIKTILNLQKGRVFLLSNINYANVICCIFFSKIRNLKIITIERTPIQELDFSFSIIDLIKKKITKLLIKMFYKKAFIRIGNSHPVSKDLSLFCNEKVKTFIPFINIQRKQIKKFNKKQIYITWIGRISPEKNIEDFLISLRYLKNYHLKINLVSDKDINIKDYNIPKKIIKNITFIKFNSKKLNLIYHKTDILISTSLYEGFPNVIAEAINYNCLIISSQNYGGANELVKNLRSGLMYELGNPKDLAIKIKFTYKNKALIKKIITNSKRNLIQLSKKHNKNYNNLFEKI